jgi:Zn-dependent protease
VVRGFGKVARLGGTTVYVHWTVIVIAAIALLGDVEHIASTLFLVVSYLGVLLLHEWGHARVARGKGYGVWSIELYPLHGITRYDAPHSHYDACVVAWGGVLAQLAVGLPLVLWAVVFGFTSIGVINAAIAIFGYLSLLWVALNLLPVAHLDGALAWQILPYLWRRRSWFRSGPKRPDVDRGKRIERKGGWVH